MNLSELPAQIRAKLIAAVKGFRPELKRNIAEIEKAGDNVFHLVALFAWQKTEDGFKFWQSVNLECPRITITEADLC